MNASDIVKAKQNKVLYTAYYTPLISSSTIYTTRSVYSTNSVHSSFISCLNITYNVPYTPAVTSYETLNQLKNGAYDCGVTSRSQLQFTGTANTTIYGFSTLYSSFNTAYSTQNIAPSSMLITSTLATVPVGPLITPFITFNQGCNQCNVGNTCQNCVTML
jgi:hypothetical protein